MSLPASDSRSDAEVTADGLAEIEMPIDKLPRVEPRKQSVDVRRLRQIVAGLTEGVILVDPDQTILWANDAALRMHGVTEVEDLGTNVTEYRKRFRLNYRNHHLIGEGAYPLDRVVAGESFTEVIVEVTPEGADEPQWVHQLRSLVLTDEQDEADFLVLIIQDVSLRFEAEERFEQTFNANPAPALICRLSDQRFVKINQGFVDLTGYDRADVLGRTIYEINVLEDVDDRDLAIERLREGRTIPQMQADLRLPDGSRRMVIVAGQPIDLNDQNCMLFTFADLEPRRQSDNELRHSEERFQTAFKLAPVGIVVATLADHTLCDVNEAFAEMTGYTQEELVGRTTSELKMWESQAARLEIEGLLNKSGDFRGRDSRIKTKTGQLVDCLLSAAIINLRGKPCVLWVVQDITERRHSEFELISAIESVMKDTNWFSRTVVEKLANLRSPNSQDHQPEISELTPREKEVLSMVCEGLDDDALASRMNVSKNTVRNHIARIYSKIGVNRRGAAIVWARERGFPLVEHRR